MGTSEVKQAEKTLQDCFCLSHSFGVILPTKDNQGQFIPEVRRERFLAFVRDELTREFGGSSSTEIYGTYLADSGKVIAENGTKIESFADSDSDEKQAFVVKLAEYLKNELQQESVSVLANNKLYFV